MNENISTIPDCDGTLFNDNVSRFPAGELARYAGRYVAWSLDGTRILASGNDYDELDRNLVAAGLRQGSFVEDHLPEADRPTVLQ